MGIREAHRERRGSGIGHSEKGAQAALVGSTCLWTQVPGECPQLQKKEVRVELSAKSGWSLFRAWRGWKLCFNWFLLFQNLPFVLLMAPQVFSSGNCCVWIADWLTQGFSSVELSVMVPQSPAVHPETEILVLQGPRLQCAVSRSEARPGSSGWPSCSLSLSCAHLGRGQAQAPENNPHSSSLLYLGPPFAFWNSFSYIFFRIKLLACN